MSRRALLGAVLVLVGVGMIVALGPGPVSPDSPETSTTNAPTSASTPAGDPGTDAPSAAANAEPALTTQFQVTTRSAPATEAAQRAVAADESDDGSSRSGSQVDPSTTESTESEPTTEREPTPNPADGPDEASVTESEADGPTPIDGCTVIDEPGAYELTENVTDASATVCIEIDANDVVFDGGGHVVDGTDENETVGLLVRTDTERANVTVRNVTVRDWDDGVRASDLEPGHFSTIDGETLSDSRFERVTSTSNVGTGIHLFDPERVVIAYSTVEGNGGMGVVLRFLGDDDVVENSTIADNGDTGLRAYEGGSYLTVRDNTVIGNGGDGVRLQNDVDRSAIVDNVVTDNGGAGIAVSTAWNETIARNRVESNRGPGLLLDETGLDRVLDNALFENAEGILLTYADDNRIERNEARENDAGIVLRDADDNALVYNVVCDNGGGDQIQIDDASEANALTDNVVDCG